MQILLALGRTIFRLGSRSLRGLGITGEKRVLRKLSVVTGAGQVVLNFPRRIAEPGDGCHRNEADSGDNSSSRGPSLCGGGGGVVGRDVVPVRIVRRVRVHVNRAPVLSRS